MLSLEPELPPAAPPVPHPDSPYWRFYEAVAAAQLLDWLLPASRQVLDLSGDGPDRARQLRDVGHDVLHVGTTRVTGVGTVTADSRSLRWVADASFDAVIAESRALSRCLAAEEAADDLARVLRPGGQLLLVVDSLVTGLATLADQGRWAELADVPAADVVLVPDGNGAISRCFSPEELRGLLHDSGFDVDWIRPRSVLSPLAVEQALATGSASTMATLVRHELMLAVERQDESPGLHLVVGARRRS